MPAIIGLQKSNLSRREEVILLRLTIGHCYLIHGHMLRGENPPWYIPCDHIVNVTHLLFECPLYRNQQIKNEIFSSNILEGEDHIRNIKNYLSEIDLLKYMYYYLSNAFKHCYLLNLFVYQLIASLAVISSSTLDSQLYK